MPEFNHGKNLRSLIDIKNINQELSTVFTKYGLTISDTGSDNLTLDLNRFYVVGGPGWLSCRIEIFITARAKIKNIKIPPKQFYVSKRVYFCSLTDNDIKFEKTINEMLAGELSNIIDYIFQQKNRQN